MGKTKEAVRKALIWLRLIPVGCIADTRERKRCTRKAYPYCKAHNPEQTIVRPRKVSDWQYVSGNRDGGILDVVRNATDGSIV